MVLNYIYTGQMDVNIDQVEEIIMLAKQCRLDALIEKLEDRMHKTISFGEQFISSAKNALYLPVSRMPAIPNTLLGFILAVRYAQ